MPRSLAAASHAAGGSGLARLAHLPGRWQQHLRRREGSRELLLLGDHLIADSGMDPYELRQDDGMPFWKLLLLSRLTPF